MRFAVACYINDDSDLLAAWLEHYRAMGAEEFWFIVQGAPADNAALAEQVARSPDLHILDVDSRSYTSERRMEGCARLVEHLSRCWVMLVDSDEFVELPPPARSLPDMARILRGAGADCLEAPMLHRVAPDGRLSAFTPGHCLDATYPLAVPDLYVQVGIPLSKTGKFPFFHVGEGVRYNRTHLAPHGSRVSPRVRGVTHHYKWRSGARDRIERRANSAHTWASESQHLFDYLAARDWRLPTSGAFRASTDELVARGWFS